jgi:hypothetical protein
MTNIDDDIKISDTNGSKPDVDGWQDDYECLADGPTVSAWAATALRACNTWRRIGPDGVLAGASTRLPGSRGPSSNVGPLPAITVTSAPGS